MSVIHIASDYHLDTDRNAWVGPLCDDYDVAVNLGDTRSPGSHGLRDLRSMYPDRSRPLVAVAGNHCFYSDGDRKRREADPSIATTWERERAIMKEVAAELGIVFLDDDVFEHDGVRYIGSTLWTGLDARPSYESINDVIRTGIGRNGMFDYRHIKVGQGRSRDQLRPQDTLAAHRKSVRFIEGVLAEPFDGPTVVLSHHAPSYRSLWKWTPEHPTFAHGDAFYASNLEGLMEGPNAPAMWAHGHIHQSRDYTVGDCRVLANPRGRVLANGLRENPHFDPMLTVEIEPTPTPRMGM